MEGENSFMRWAQNPPGLDPAPLEPQKDRPKIPLIKTGLGSVYTIGFLARSVVGWLAYANMRIYGFQECLGQPGHGLANKSSAY